MANRRFPDYRTERYCRNLVAAIQSLDSLNDQIVQFIFTPKARDLDADIDDDACLQPKQREALKSSMALMRRLLLDAQGKFRKMVEDNKQLASRIDGDIQSAHEEVNVLRAELADTNRRINELTTAPVISTVNDNSRQTPTHCARCLNCNHLDENQVKDEVSELRAEAEKLSQQNRSLQREVDELGRLKEHFLAEDNDLRPRVQKLETELQQAKEAVTALKADRKRLKAEKFDLLNQMKQLYGTLEDKERELRDFIRNYEHRMKESDDSLKQISQPKMPSPGPDQPQARRQLSQLGYYSDQESVTSRANGFHTPTASTPVNLPNGRELTPTSLGTPGSAPIDTPGDLTPSITVDAMECDGSPIYAAMSVCNDSSSSPPPLAQGLSRSAEELTHVLSTLDLKKKGHRRNGAKSTWGSISRVFSRSRSRRSIDGGTLFEEEKRTSWSPYTSLCASPLAEESYTEKVRLLEEAQRIPMERWRASIVLAWLEVSLGMPQYASLCAENIKSGKILLELTDGELETGLGIINPMHRRKLRLAIEEHRDPSTWYPKIGELSHLWVCGEWIPGLGLTQYVEAFVTHLVDGRMLEHLTRKEMEKFLGVGRKFHQASILHGIHLLRMFNYDKQALTERRIQCEDSDCDVLVWTNQRFIKWAKTVDLAEYSDNLRDSGVHGALVVLETSFSADTMAAALGIPQSKNIIRRHLTTELEALVQPAREALEQEVQQQKALKKEKGGAMVRNFSRSYAGGLHVAKSRDNRRSSLRGSLSRALGLKVKGQESPVTTLPPPAPRSPKHPPQRLIASVETHRRVKSSGDIETVTVTPV